MSRQDEMWAIIEKQARERLRDLEARVEMQRALLEIVVTKRNAANA